MIEQKLEEAKTVGGTKTKQNQWNNCIEDVEVWCITIFVCFPFKTRLMAYCDFSYCTFSLQVSWSFAYARPRPNLIHDFECLELWVSVYDCMFLRPGSDCPGDNLEPY